MIEASSAKGRRFAKYGPLVMVGLLFLGIHQVYLAVVHPAAVYMDSLRILSHLYAWEQGRMTISELWGYGGTSHRGLIFQIFLYLNSKLLSLDVLLANRLTGSVVLLVGILLSGHYIKSTLSVPEFQHGSRRWLAYYFAVIFVALGFSPAGFELFTLELGLALWCKNLTFILYFIAQDRLFRRPSRYLSVGLSFAGPLIVLVVAMGWSYAFIGAVLGVHTFAALTSRNREGLWAAVPPSLAVILAGVAYVSGGGSGDEMPLPNLIQKFASACWLACHALGSAFIGVEAGARFGVPHWVPGVLGLCMLCAAVLLVLPALLRRRWDGTFLPLHLMMYGFLVALAVSYARGGAGTDAVMAPRYYMDLYLFPIGLFWVWSRSVFGRFSIALLVALQIFLWAGQLLTQWYEWHAAPYRREAIAEMNRVTSIGIIDDQEASLLQAPKHDARAGIAAMRKWGLGVFRGQIQGLDCDDNGIQLAKGWYTIEGAAVWMSRTAVIAVPPCRCGVTTQVYLPESFTARQIAVQDHLGREVTHVDLVPGRSSTLRFPPSAESSLMVIESSAVTVPSLELGSADNRELSSLWRLPTFECSSPAPRQ